MEETPRVTNRAIASKLGVSVKLAHELLGKLVSKGLLHVKKHHARRWDYFLTPRGLAEKARLTYEFLDFSFQFYREARRRSADLIAKLKQAGVKSVAFLGTGELAEIALPRRGGVRTEGRGRVRRRERRRTLPKAQGQVHD